jgi:hypothetical protein
MPYTGPGDDTLPDNVKKLPDNKRAQWVHVFNSTLKNCLSENTGGGAGTQAKCESTAFRFANGVAKKELEEMEEGEKVGRMISAANAGEIMAAVSQLQAVLKKAGITLAAEEPGQAEEVKAALDAYERENEEMTLFGKIKELFFGQKVVTKTEGGDSFPAADYAYVPDAESPSTWKLRLTESPGKLTVIQVARAITALQPSGFRGQKVDIPSGDKSGVISKISGAIGRIPGASDDQRTTLRDRLNAVKQASSAFTVTKDKAGNLRWLTITSNRYYDRDEEVFPEAVHQEAVKAASEKGDYPELWLWHTPGSRIGKGDWADYADGFRFDSGTIDPGSEGVAVKLAHADLGVSHGFTFVREGDTYTQYMTHEVSPLPRQYAANPWTGLVVEKEENRDMGFTTEKRAFLVDALGEDKVAQIEVGATALRKELEDAGAAFKDLLDEGEVGTGAQAATVDLAPLTGLLEELKGGIAKMQETLTGLEGQVTDQDKAIKALQKTDDEKVAAGIAPKGALRPDQSPANKDGNIVSEEEARKEGAGGPPPSPVSAFVAQAERTLGLQA